jgi:hypothetical protein
MSSSVVTGVLIVLFLVLAAIGSALLAAHFRPRRPRTEAHHGHPSLGASAPGQGDAQPGTVEDGRDGIAGNG